MKNIKKLMKNNIKLEEELKLHMMDMRKKLSYYWRSMKIFEEEARTTSGES